MALCVISLSMSRFLLPHVQQPEETPEEKKKSNLPTFFYYQRMGNLNLLICAACGISFSAGFFYNLVVFLRPMGEPTPLILTLLFGIGGLLAIVFLKLPLEKDIYQAFLLVVPFLLCGYVPRWATPRFRPPRRVPVRGRIGHVDAPPEKQKEKTLCLPRIYVPRVLGRIPSLFTALFRRIWYPRIGYFVHILAYRIVIQLRCLYILALPGTMFYPVYRKNITKK